MSWLKQTASKPLFEDVLWSRPETKGRAGKLLAIGGNMHGLAVPATAYAAALHAGIGSCRVLLPDVTAKILGKGVFEADFAPSNPSGSFARSALDSFIENAQWADGVLLAGDFGRNSETAVVLDSFITKYEGRLTVAGDGLDYFLASRSPILERADTLAVINLGKLQKLAKNNRPGTPILHSMSLHELVSALAEWTGVSPVSFITRHGENLVVVSGGRASTTPYNDDIRWQVELPAYASVWWLQQPLRTFEALTCAVYDYQSEATA